MTALRVPTYKKRIPCLKGAIIALKFFVVQDFKHLLYQYCREHIQQQLQDADRVIADVREAMASETKSSAGDKYETAREMFQQEIDKNMGRRQEAQKQMDLLERLSPAPAGDKVVPGSLVDTSQGLYYLSVSIGKAQVQGQPVFIISSASPMGALLLGATAGTELSWRGQRIRIHSVR